MNCKQLNKNKLSDILLIFGHHPIRQNKNESWYLNPFSKETKASFKIDSNKNIWYLHSEGVGGNVVDFLVRYLKYSIPEVLKWAEDRNFSFSFQKQINIVEPSYSIIEVKKLYSYPLKNYLLSRGITESTWKYVKEVKFCLQDKIFYAIGFSNISDGWEVRNSFYKGNLNGKDISFIQNKNSKVIRIFEGFMDFLSFKEIYPKDASNYIILNSIALIEKGLKLIHLDNEIYLYLDNDLAGEKSKEYIISKFPRAIDCSRSYLDHKDLNEFLIEYKNAKIYPDVPLCPHGNLAFTPDGHKRIKNVPK